MSECFVDIYCDEKTIRSVSRSPKKVFCLFLRFFVFVLSNFFIFIFNYRCQNVSLIFTATKRQSVRLLGRKERCFCLFVCFCFLTVSECFTDIHFMVHRRTPKSQSVR